MATESLNGLIDRVRLKIGDLDPAQYRYIDAWILTSLIAAVEKFQRYCNNKYFVDETTGDVSRNSNPGAYTFTTPESMGVIEASDKPVLVLLAAIEILGGSLENSAWNLSSWKDAEISFSNLTGGNIREGNLKSLQDELNSLIKPPSKRLAWAISQPLPGYKHNNFENNTEF